MLYNLFGSRSWTAPARGNSCGSCFHLSGTFLWVLWGYHSRQFAEHLPRTAFMAVYRHRKGPISWPDPIQEASPVYSYLHVLTLDHELLCRVGGTDFRDLCRKLHHEISPHMGGFPGELFRTWYHTHIHEPNHAS
jgi:hypothetical protein